MDCYRKGTYLYRSYCIATLHWQALPLAPKLPLRSNNAYCKACFHLRAILLPPRTTLATCMILSTTTSCKFCTKRPSNNIGYLNAHLTAPIRL